MESLKHPSTGMIIGIIVAVVIVLIIIGLIWWLASKKTVAVVPVVPATTVQPAPVVVGASRVSAPSRKVGATFRQILGRKN